jgi:hypothetical protein
MAGRVALEHRGQIARTASPIEGAAANASSKISRTCIGDKSSPPIFLARW